MKLNTLIAGVNFFKSRLIKFTLQAKKDVEKKENKVSKIQKEITEIVRDKERAMKMVKKIEEFLDE